VGSPDTNDRGAAQDEPHATAPYVRGVLGFERAAFFNEAVFANRSDGRRDAD
jgi:hypothetical protein